MSTNRVKAKQRISYVLPLTDSNSAYGHRLGVDSLAIDRDRSILYSGGRDGAICSWNLNEPFSARSDGAVKKSTARSQIQAHTHWVNDIALVHNNQAVVSASSDCSVKIWRPHSQDSQIPSTVGLHSDYAKCLASPGPGVDWIASGGFDKTIRIWDLNANKEKLQIDANEGDKSNKKGSIYSLRIAGGIMASGAPDGIVRIWDYRSGRRITRLTGHTSYVRALLINDLGDTVMSAASDSSVKVWSLKTGRCMHTLTMHNDSVWRLWSDDPELSVFYSADKSGIIVKTDARYRPSLDEALSVTVAKEHEMITNMTVAGDHIWVSTPNSSINRWRNVSTDLNRPKASISHGRQASLASRPRGLSETPTTDFGPEIPEGIPAESVIATTAVARAGAVVSKFKELDGFNPGFANGNKAEIQFSFEQDEAVRAVRDKPEETIEGQIGLRRHVLLNDRRRVLTLDTAGGVILWDLITCQPLHNYGKQNLDGLVEELNTEEAVPNWCSIDTGTGRLAVTLNESDAFEAEIYGDEMGLGEGYEFGEQSRVSYGKWVLRYLFAGLLDEEKRRDEEHRASLKAQQSQGLGLGSRMATVPETRVTTSDDDEPVTARKFCATTHATLNPGFGIGVATPGVFPSSPGAAPQSPLLTAKTSGTDLEKQTSRNSGDYFTRNHGPSSGTGAAATPAPPTSRGKESEEAPASAELPQSPSEEKESKSGFFSPRTFRMKFPKKLGRNSSEVAKADGDKAEDGDKESEKEAPVFEDSFLGTVQAIRYDYGLTLQANPEEELQSGIVPIPLEEAPIVSIPMHVSIVIQEEKSDSGGVVDLYRGTVRSAAKEADTLERLAPQWLGELLLRNVQPTRDPNRLVKLAFILVPYDDKLPPLPSDASANSTTNTAQPPARLTAPRVLRAKKVVEYVAERLNPPDSPIAPDGPQPEEYLEIYCSNRLVPLNMTLQTVRAMVWKGGSDITLQYRSNGRWPKFDEYYEARLSVQAAAEAKGSSEAAPE